MRSIDTSTLLSSGRQLDLPASIEVRLGDSVGKVTQTLELLELFRILPRKRCVILARWQGALVVAKLFYARGRWEQHLQREVQGIEALSAAGILTAELLGSGTLRDEGGGFLLLRYIAGGTGLGIRWEQADESERELLLKKVVALIADCHERGLIQKDIHLDNFLLKNDSVFLLDAGDLGRYQHSADGVDSVNSLRNLALFLAQFPVSNDVMAPALYEYYRQQRPSADISEDMAVFAALLRKKRALRLKHVLSKLYRETSANVVKRNWNQYAVYERSLESESLQAFLQTPDAFIERGTMMKAGGTTTVVRIELDGKCFVVKRYNMKSFWHLLGRLFRPSRAWVCWRNAHMLEMLGVHTPKPLLMLERRYGPLRAKAYFLCEYVLGEDALLFLNREPINSPDWKRVLSQFKTIFATLRDYNLVHGDMKATNFLVTERGLAVLDLDGMHHESDSQRFFSAREKDLQRFAKNWEDDPARSHEVKAMLVQLQDESDYFTKGS